MSKKLKQDKDKENYGLMIPIFRLKPEYNDDYVIVKMIGTIREGDTMQDEQMDFETDKEMKDKYGQNLLFISKVDTYTLMGKFFSCNITGDYLLSNTKLPIFYLSIMYERQFVTGFLYSYYVYFTPDAKTQAELTEPKKYLNTNLHGTYTIELVTDDDFMNQFINFTKPILEEQMLEEMADLHKDELVDELTMNRMIQQVLDNVELKMKQYIELLSPIKIDITNNKNVFIKTIKELCKNETFLELVKYSVQLRDFNRRGGKEGNFNYKLPKRIFDLATLKSNPNKIDEMLNDETLDRSSEESD